VNTTKKENPTFFFVFLCNLLFQESLFCCASLCKRQEKKKEATASKTVQLAKQHISKSCD
jgi:hypothetical protein